MGQASKVISLSEATLRAYEDYVRHIDPARSSVNNFLWCDGSVDRALAVESGKVVVEQLADERSSVVENGMLHDWVGAIRIPGATASNVRSLLQDYDNHAKVFHPDVLDSKLLARSGDHFEIYLRLVKKKVITVVLDTWHTVDYRTRDDVSGYCRSFTTRVCEIEHPGKTGEFARFPDTGYGYLWRMYSIWRFEERSGGTIVECRVVSLTRDIPSGLGWIMSPMVQKLPAESLKATLEATRRALTSAQGQAASRSKNAADAGARIEESV
jgi:hypothetical protein